MAASVVSPDGLGQAWAVPYVAGVTTPGHHGTVELYYEDHGAGRPVVLVHGWPLSGRAWEKQVFALVAAGYRVVTYDRRGFGRSSQPWSGYDYDTFTADLEVVMRHLDLRDVTLVGFSMGGGEAVRFTAQDGGSRVAQMVLLAAVPPYLYRSEDNPEGGVDDATIQSLEEGVRGDRLAFLDGFTKGFFGVDRRPELLSEPARHYFWRIASEASPKGTLDCIRAFSATDFRSELAAITVPTLVLHGDSDTIVPFEVSGRRSHEAIAGSRLVVVEGGPHGLTATHADEVNDALLDFLRA
jgi:pimeloyl-ACP methyl ester carboxylesterase